MHRVYLPLIVASLLGASVAMAAEPEDPNLSYPGAVALGQNSSGQWGYKSFPELLPLYVFDGEPAGRSLCDRDCTAVWPIVEARSTDAAVGLWSIVKREDGRLQWAYKNSPVYTYFEDSPNEPKGAGKNMDWYLDEQGAAYLASVGVEDAATGVDEARGKGSRKGEKKAGAAARDKQVIAQLLQP